LAKLGAKESGTFPNMVYNSKGTSHVFNLFCSAISVSFNILLEITDSFVCFHHYYSFAARVTTTVISSDVKQETSEFLDSNHNNNRSL